MIVKLFMVNEIEPWQSKITKNRIQKKNQK